jgi:hypothetical protein
LNGVLLYDLPRKPTDGKRGHGRHGPQNGAIRQMSIPATCRDSAVALVRRGLHVFRLQFRKKEPLKNSNGFKDAIADERRARTLWSVGLYNVGIATGTPLNGLTLGVLDLDGGGAIALLDVLERERGKLPETFTTKTARGKHLYLQVPALPSRIGLLPGIDWKAVGGYVVAANSVHPTGVIYCALDWTAPIAVAPDWLIDLVTPPQAPEREIARKPVIISSGDRWAQAALERELETLRAAGEGSRNATLNRSAFLIGQLVQAEMLDESDVKAALKAATTLPDEEADATIRRAFRAAATKPRTVLGGSTHAA